MRLALVNNLVLLNYEKYSLRRQVFCWFQISLSCCAILISAAPCRIFFYFFLIFWSPFDHEKGSKKQKWATPVLSFGVIQSTSTANLAQPTICCKVQVSLWRNCNLPCVLVRCNANIFSKNWYIIVSENIKSMHNAKKIFKNPKLLGRRRSLFFRSGWVE